MATNRFIAVLTAALSAAIVMGQDQVGFIGSSKGATYSVRPTAASPNYVAPAAGQPVRNGDGVRTARKGYAQINFNDKTALRLAELSELIVQDSVSLRRLQLGKGALWVRVTKGSNTAIQTPVATATVRGTELLIDDQGNLAVREGVVELEANGFTIEVLAGEIAGVGPDGKPYKKGIRIPTEEAQDPVEFGVPDLWWKTLRGDTGSKHKDDWAAALVLLPFLFTRDGGHRDRQAPVPEPSSAIAIAAGASIFISAKLRKKRQS